MSLRIPGTRRLAFIGALLIALAGALAYSTVAFAGDDVDTYRVTITNLTEGQPFTPPVIWTHKKSGSQFKLGDSASLEIKEVAENGNSGPLAAALAGNGKVFGGVVDGLPPIVPASEGRKSV